MLDAFQTCRHSKNAAPNSKNATQHDCRAEPFHISILRERASHSLPPKTPANFRIDDLLRRPLALAESHNRFGCVRAYNPRCRSTPAVCAVRTTLSHRKSGLSPAGGSSSKTSRPAPARRPFLECRGQIGFAHQAAAVC